MPIQARGEGAYPTETGCEEAPFSLSYVSYGITAPPQQEGWRCNVFTNEAISSPDRMVDWRRTGKKIEFSELALDDKISGLLHHSKQQEPEATIRGFVEIFLGDNAVLGKSRLINSISEDFVDSVNGIIWSKSNEQMIVYTFDEGNKENNEEEQASVFIYKKGQDKKFLLVNCWGCSLEELFSIVISPAARN